MTPAKRRYRRSLFDGLKFTNCDVQRPYVGADKGGKVCFGCGQLKRDKAEILDVP